MSAARAAVRAFIGIGANLGDAPAAVLAAMQAIDQLPGCRIRGRSSLYGSAPVQASGPDFVNAVLEIDSHLSAPELLAGLQNIERAAGRQRPFRNAPRTLDLDLLLFGYGCISSPTLTVPHPRAGQRAFVLVPLAELAPHQAERLRDPAWSAALAQQSLRRL